MGGAYGGDVAYSALYANPGHSNHRITLRLEGVQTNRSAIGARLKVTIQTAGGVQNIYRTVGSGGSFGCNPLRQEIGLGQAHAIEKMEIYWPVSRKTQTLHGLQQDHFYNVREGQDQAAPIFLKAAAWPKPTVATARR